MVGSGTSRPRPFQGCGFRFADGGYSFTGEVGVIHPLSAISSDLQVAHLVAVQASSCVVFYCKVLSCRSLFTSWLQVYILLPGAPRADPVMSGEPEQEAFECPMV